MAWTEFGWENDPSTDTPLSAAKLEEFGEHIYDTVAAASQPVDSDLTAIAALTTTSYGRAFLALADAAAGRTALGLGTAATSASGAFQAADSDLTALAALTTTSFGRALLELADAAAGRTALGVEAAGTSIPKSTVDAAGDLLVGTADNTVGRLAKGTDGQVLKMSAGAVAWGADDAGSGAVPSGTDGQILGYVGTTPTALDVDDAVTAADIPFVPAGGIAATNVQTAIEEAKTDSATAASSALTTHEADTTSVHGITNTALLALKPTLTTKTADYTFALADAWNKVYLSGATGRAFTVPPNASVAFAVGDEIEVGELGAGVLTITAGVGVTVETRADKTLVLDGAGSVATLLKTATNTWLLTGELVAA